MSGVAGVAAAAHNPLPTYTTFQKVGFCLFGAGFAAIVSLGVLMQIGTVRASLAGRFGIMTAPAVVTAVGIALTLFCRRAPQNANVLAPHLLVPKPAANRSVPAVIPAPSSSLMTGNPTAVPPSETFPEIVYVPPRGQPCLGTSSNPIVGQRRTGNDKMILNAWAAELRPGNCVFRMELRSLADPQQAASSINTLLKALGKAAPGTEIEVGDGSDTPANRALIHAFLKQVADDVDLGCGGNHLRGPLWDIAVYTDDRERLADIVAVTHYQRWPRHLRFYKPSLNHPNVVIAPGYIWGYVNALEKSAAKSVGLETTAQPQPEKVLAPSQETVKSMFLTLWNCGASLYGQRFYSQLRDRDTLLSICQKPSKGRLLTGEAAFLIFTLYHKDIPLLSNSEQASRLAAIREPLIRLLAARAESQEKLTNLLRPPLGTPSEMSLNADDFMNFLTIIEKDSWTHGLTVAAAT